MRPSGAAGVDVCGEGAGGVDGGGCCGKGVGVYFGGGEQAVAGFVGPVEGDGCGEGDEEGVEGYEGLVGAELVAEAGPGWG